MKKEEGLQSIVKTWDEFIEAAKSVSELEKPGVVGSWNLRESLIHVAVWDYELMKAIQGYIKNQQKPEYSDMTSDRIDALNAQQVEDYKHLSIAEVWDLLDNNHMVLVEFLTQLPDDVFMPETFNGDAIRAETWEHYQEHKSDIDKFIENNSA
ncbi:MAG: hypothetical protein CL785_00560 [Chloroflexi bacterium]|nr:hypothetical protein [Chloroflexota bacterium]|tara:strand:+ start:2046 stop:2504 length:459 start_codon:yes stop_codon:yes gene_type:complete